FRFWRHAPTRPVPVDPWNWLPLLGLPLDVRSHPVTLAGMPGPLLGLNHENRFWLLCAATDMEKEGADVLLAAGADVVVLSRALLIRRPDLACHLATLTEK